jgi:hypothetical protein
MTPIPSSRISVWRNVICGGSGWSVPKHIVIPANAVAYDAGRVIFRAGT